MNIQDLKKKSSEQLIDEAEKSGYLSVEETNKFFAEIKRMAN